MNINYERLYADIVNHCYSDCDTNDIPEWVVLDKENNIKVLKEYIEASNKRWVDMLKIIYSSDENIKTAEIAEIMGISKSRINELKHSMVRHFWHLNYSLKLFHTPFNEDDIYSNKIEVCGFSTGLYNCLWRYGIVTVKDLKNKSLTGLMNIRNMGFERAKELLSFMDKYNIPYIADDQKIVSRIYAQSKDTKKSLAEIRKCASDLYNGIPVEDNTWTIKSGNNEYVITITKITK